MQIGFHHYQKHVESSQELTDRQKKLNRIMDDVIYVIGTFGVLIYIPQLVQVLTAKDISGVSLISWVGMFVASVFWLAYGTLHKAKPIIYINALAAIIQLSVVLGILLHR